MTKISLLGHGFIGKAHAHAYASAPHFFDLKDKPVLNYVYGRDLSSLSSFAQRFNFQNYTNDLKLALRSSEVIDNCLPNYLHYKPALEALEGGKAVLLEKPMAMNVEQAEQLAKAAKGKSAMIAFNYRFLPAVALAKRLITEGKIGEVHEFRAAYLHDSLANPKSPAGWRQIKEYAGTGALGDLGSHVIDMARFLVGEVSEVSGQTQILYPERPSREGSVKIAVDDSFTSLVKFANGATGVLEASKVAPGMKNFFRFEVHGNSGTIAFNLERPNELSFYAVEQDKGMAGFKTIMATDPSHPYAAAFWPPGHVLGWEHAINIEIAHFLRAIEGDEKIEPGATFEDGLRAQKVIAAIERSAQSGKWEKAE